MKQATSTATAFLFILFSSTLAQAQGIVYLSNLDQPFTLAVSPGSGRWTAIPFVTGTNLFGYTLNSIQVEISGTDGNPSSYSLMLYRDNSSLPGSNLQTLDGSAPTGAGIYTYTSSGSQLSPLTTYWIVTTWTNAVSNVYWNIPDSANYASSDGWTMNNSPCYFSNNGSSWNNSSGSFLEFAINATSVPEPSAWAFLIVGSGLLVASAARRSSGLGPV